MNQEKIGKFISECRKKQNLTQEQLAEKLNITSKAISKWEKGKSIPDVSIMQDLCRILNITLNDLFNGEKIADEDYKKVADENLLSALEDSTFTREEKIKFYKKKYRKEHRINIILAIVFVIMFIVLSRLPQYFPEVKKYCYLISAISMLFYINLPIIYDNAMMKYVEDHVYNKIEK